MADITGFFIDKVAAPVLSGVGGVALSLWRLQKSLSDRLTAVENAWKQFSEKDYPREKTELGSSVSAASAAAAAALAGVRAELKDLQGDIQREIDGLRSDLHHRSRDRAEARRLQTRLSERYMALEQRVEQCEKSIQELNGQFENFAREQNDQWQTMIRSIGQLEGYLQGIFRKDSSSGFQSPVKK